VAYSAICSEEPKKTTKNLRIEYLRRKMWTQDFQTTFLTT
jgi:hypothetical protein